MHEAALSLTHSWTGQRARTGVRARGLVNRSDDLTGLVSRADIGVRVVDLWWPAFYGSISENRRPRPV